MPGRIISPLPFEAVILLHFSAGETKAQRDSVIGPKVHSLWEGGGGGPHLALSTPLVAFRPSFLGPVGPAFRKQPHALGAEAGW